MSVVRGDIAAVGDYRAFALKRAQSLGVFTSTPAVFEDPFTDKLGAGASKWKTTLGGTGAVSILQDVSGGVARMDSGGSASGSVLAPIGAGTDLPSLIPDPGITASRWYLFWVFRVPTTVDNKAAQYVELTKASGSATNSVYIGVDGAFASTTKFMVEDNTAATLSTVSIDANWHYVEVWQTGTARVVKFSFDNEAPVSFTMAANNGGFTLPRFWVANGTTAASQKLDNDHFIMLTPSNVTLPNT